MRFDIFSHDFHNRTLYIYVLYFTKSLVIKHGLTHLPSYFCPTVKTVQGETSILTCIISDKILWSFHTLIASMGAVHLFPNLIFIPCFHHFKGFIHLLISLFFALQDEGRGGGGVDDLGALVPPLELHFAPPMSFLCGPGSTPAVINVYNKRSVH